MAKTCIYICETLKRKEAAALDDQKLLQRLKKDEPAALEAIIDRYAPYTAAVVSNQLGAAANTQDVEELVSDVFLALWRNRDRLKTTHLRGWLAATARNAARGRMRRLGLPTLPAEDALLVSGGDLTELAERRERAEYIRAALDALGPPDNEVFLRYYYYNESVSQIAEEMGMNVSTVKSKLQRGRSKLKEKLEKGGYSCEFAHQ